MATLRHELIEILGKAYPSMFLRTTEEFNGGEGGIWSSGEDNYKAKDGYLLLDYYAEDRTEEHYIFGVHRELHDLLDSHGWYAEWHDCGTIMFWEI
jgi:hypothetical protein